MINDRIDQALKVWEICCLNSKILVRMMSMRKSGIADDMLTGPIKNSESFRKDILNGKPFDTSRYIQQNVASEALGVFSYFPASIHAWATKSRRIYTLDSDIQELILQTDVSQLSWKDIVFPFDAFGIALARPIQEPNGQWFDFLLVHRGYMHAIDREGISIWAISREFERPADELLRRTHRAYDDLVARGKFKRAQEVTDFFSSARSMETVLGAKLNCFIADSIFFDRPLADAFSFVKQNDGKIISGGLLPSHTQPYSSHTIEVERLVAGFCVYMDTHRNTANAERIRTPWESRRDPTIDPNCITKEALVCTVQNVYELDDLERELLTIIDSVERKRRCDELGVHYREGYARRRPGFGHDPSAPQCVHVRPAIVGLRRLAPGSLPPGTAKVL